MPKSLLLTSTFAPRIGGRELYLSSVFSCFSQEELVVVTWDREGDWKAFDEKCPSRIFRKDETDFLWYIRGRRGRLKWFAFLGMLCIKEQIDIVHCGVAIPDGMSGWLLKQVLGIPYVVYTYAKEILGPWPTVKEEERVRQALSEADKVVTISRFTRDRLLDLGVSPAQVEMVYPGVDVDIFRPDKVAGQRVRNMYGIANQQPVLLTVARLAPGEGQILRKGHDNVLEALPSILKVAPETMYMIVGTGPEEDRLRALVKKKGLTDHVIFAGHVSSEDLPSYYNAADVFIMPNREEGSNVEGFGIVFLEANACEKPVIGGRSGGTTDAIADGQSGYLVDPSNTQQIAKAAIQLINDPALARKMGKQGRERARIGFTWEKATRQVYTLTEGIATKSTQSRAKPTRLHRLARSWRFFLEKW